jgi:hypothetical protein
LNAALEGPVIEIVFDFKSKADFRSLLESVPNTEFDSAEVKRILEDVRKPENWRVGEAIAESYLVHHRDCTFPWPDGRDERKSGSSLPGADLVGFEHDGGTDRFVFGEVKTSSDHAYPPGAMYGRTGLKQQLEDLRDNVRLRDDLVMYLFHRAKNASWKSRFICAYTRYNSNNKDVKLFGLLVRDVQPHKDDLNIRVIKLIKGCLSPMAIELLAIYLPVDSIEKLSDRIITMRKGSAS